MLSKQVYIFHYWKYKINRKTKIKMIELLDCQDTLDKLICKLYGILNAKLDLKYKPKYNCSYLPKKTFNPLTYENKTTILQFELSLL